MRLRKLAASVLLTTLAAAVIPHAAASTVVAQASTSVVLSYRLVDLDLDDGITPWIQFSDTSQLALGYAIESNADPLITTRPGGIFSAPDASYGSADGRAQMQYSTASHSTSVTLTAELFQPGSAPFTSAAIAHFYGSTIDPDFGFAMPLEGEYAFQLSPNTALIVEATTVLNSRLSTVELLGGTFEQYLVDARKDAFMTAGAYVDIYFDVDEDYILPLDSWAEYGMTSGASNLSLYASLLPGTDAVSDEQSLLETVYATYYNGGATSANVRFAYFTGSDIYTNVFDLPPVDPPVDPEWPPIDPPVDPGFPPVTPAIPEPSTYALMLLGLGGIAVAARQRRRQMAG